MSALDDYSLRKCRNPLCDRRTTAAYCCHACDLAHQGRYEIHESGPLGHAESCNTKHKERSQRRPRTCTIYGSRISKFRV